MQLYLVFGLLLAGCAIERSPQELCEHNLKEQLWAAERERAESAEVTQLRELLITGEGCR